VKFNKSKNSETHDIGETEQSSFNYEQEARLNYLNYLNEYCKNKEMLNKWLQSKKQHRKNKLDKIMAIYKQKLEKFQNEDKIKKILNEKIADICGKRDQMSIKSTINYIRTLLDHDINKRFNVVELDQMIEKFIYEFIDTKINENEKKLKEYLQHLHNIFNKILIKFRNRYYFYDIDKKFSKLKKSAIDHFCRDTSPLGKKCLDIVESRLKEFESTIIYSKNMTPKLNFRIIVCPSCGEKGNLRLLTNSYKIVESITIFDIYENSKVLNYSIICEKEKSSWYQRKSKNCEFVDNVKEFISKGFDFRINEKGEYISIHKK
jgi:hypothetical protein